MTNAIRAGGLLLLGLAAAMVGAGCSNTSGNPIAPIKGGTEPSATPTPTPAGSATPKPSATPATPTPVPTVTPTPSAAPSGVVGNINCTAPVVTTGTYTSIFTIGTVTGNTYTQEVANADNLWTVYVYSTPSPTPSPSPTPTVSPTPTASPIPTISPTPQPTPTPEMFTLYAGEYTVPSFTGTAGSNPYTAQATTGCFDMILVQPVGGTTGQLHSLSALHPFLEQAPDADAEGDPNYESDQQTFLDEGTITSFTVTNLTPSSGTGNFTLSNGTMGTATVTGSETFDESAPVDYKRHEAVDALFRRANGFAAYRRAHGGR